MKIQPLGDYILVKVDPLKQVSPGGIQLPGDASLSPVRTGTVVKTGPGKRIERHRLPTGVEPGEKVAFLRWHLEHLTGKQIRGALSELGDDLGLIRPDDVLFAFLEGTNVEV